MNLFWDEKESTPEAIVLRERRSPWIALVFGAAAFFGAGGFALSVPIVPLNFETFIGRVGFDAFLVLGGTACFGYLVAISWWYRATRMVFDNRAGVLRLSERRGGKVYRATLAYSEIAEWKVQNVSDTTYLVVLAKQDGASWVLMNTRSETHANNTVERLKKSIDLLNPRGKSEIALKSPGFSWSRGLEGSSVTWRQRFGALPYVFLTLVFSVAMYSSGTHPSLLYQIPLRILAAITALWFVAIAIDELRRAKRIVTIDSTHLKWFEQQFLLKEEKTLLLTEIDSIRFDLDDKGTFSFAIYRAGERARADAKPFRLYTDELSLLERLELELWLQAEVTARTGKRVA